MEKIPTTAQDALLAELLGDVGRLSDALKTIAENQAKLSEKMLETITGVERATGVLLAKGDELRRVDFAADYAEKMKAHSVAYMTALSKEISALVSIELQKQTKNLPAPTQGSWWHRFWR